MTEADHHAAGPRRRDIHIDLHGCHSKAELLARIAAALHFPPWFGHNWDALADCLGDLSWLPASGYALHCDNAQDLQAAAPEVLATLVDILQEATAFWADEGVDFHVLLDGSDITGS